MGVEWGGVKGWKYVVEDELCTTLGGGRGRRVGGSRIRGGMGKLLRKGFVRAGEGGCLYQEDCLLDR